MKPRNLRLFHVPKEQRNFRTVLLLLLPFFCFFSFHPIINLGSSHGMHFELSLLQIFLSLFALAHLSQIWRERQTIFKHRFMQAFFLFCTLNTISLFWTANFVKGFMISGVLWLLFVCALAIFSHKKIRTLLPALIESTFISTTLFSLFALFQFITGTFNLLQNVTLLCDGCVAGQLGFPRVSAFAVEPQFFANLLLIPIFLSFHFLITDKFKDRKLSSINIFCLLLFLTTLFLTLSRGAIYAFVIGIIILTIVYYKKIKQLAIVFGLSIFSFIFALSLQGISAHMNPNLSDNFSSATTRVVHQLTLGIIDLHPVSSNETTEATESPEIKSDPESTDTAEHQQTESAPEAPNFDGYIEESTNDRLLLSSLALQAWAKTPTNLLIGTGIGSTGFALAEYFPDQTGNTEITQNQYTETLLENGLIGFLILLATIILVFYITRQQRFLWPIFTAFLVQWLFFSGLPNALHLYLFIFIALSAQKPILAKNHNK